MKRRQCCNAFLRFQVTFTIIFGIGLSKDSRLRTRAAHSVIGLQFNSNSNQSWRCRYLLEKDAYCAAFKNAQQAQSFPWSRSNIIFRAEIGEIVSAPHQIIAILLQSPARAAPTWGPKTKVSNDFLPAKHLEEY